MRAKLRKRSGRQATDDGSKEIARLRRILAEAQATLRAIRQGEVDAVVVESQHGPQVFTLDNAEFDYRVLIESMNEGALVLTRRAVILYANTHFALMVERPLADIMGHSLDEVLSVPDRITLRRLLNRPGRNGGTRELSLQRPPSPPMSVRVSVQRLSKAGSRNASFGMVVSDLTDFRDREDLLRRFSHGLMQMQETERLHVATDLGENIAQMLCSILVRCQLLTDRLPAYEVEFRKEVNEFARLLRATASDVERISTALRPHGLEILGLAPALRGVVAEFAERMEVQIEVACDPRIARLPDPTELAIYRVLQEALRNVEQHARARHVAVSLKLRGAVVHLTIQDDGIGFAASEALAKGMQEGRFGLLSMRERANAVGGTLKVESTTSVGTEVRFNIPVPSTHLNGAPRSRRPPPPPPDSG